MECKRCMKVIKHMLCDSNYRFLVLAHLGVFDHMSDEKFLIKMFKARTGRNLNLSNPQTFNEKLQWLKLYDHNDRYTVMVDKYKAKEYVSDIIGSEYIIPTLDVWNSVEEIDWNSLPDQFVIKCTHDSGGLIICKDKSQLNKEKAIAKLEKCMKSDYYKRHREWPYKNVERKIIAEKYMTDNSNSSQLTDYKVYTFNGRAKMIMINKDRGVDTKADYFDTDYQCLDFSWGYPHAEVKPQKPKCFDEMIELAEKLAKDTYELRVDFYEVNGQIYFGEMTFFDGSGFDKIEPIEWDYKIGSWMKLPIGMEDIN